MFISGTAANTSFIRFYKTERRANKATLNPISFTVQFNILIKNNLMFFEVTKEVKEEEFITVTLFLFAMY